MNLILKILILFVLLLSNSLLFCQDNNKVKIEIPYKEINGKDFNGNLKMTIINNSEDTVYITMEPFECDITKGKEYCASTRYSPNTISFLESGALLFEVDCISSISYLKFPKILYLIPGNKVDIILNFGELILQEIKNSNWEIFKDIKFAFRRDVLYDLKHIQPYLLDEFNQSLFYKEIININLTLNLLNNFIKYKQLLCQLNQNNKTVLNLYFLCNAFHLPF